MTGCYRKTLAAWRLSDFADADGPLPPSPTTHHRGSLREQFEFFSCDTKRRALYIHPTQHHAQFDNTMALVRQADDELVIKPDATVSPKINYADWPLLLKNWDNRMSLHQNWL